MKNRENGSKTEILGEMHELLVHYLVFQFVHYLVDRRAVN
ncbi:hypothetical protein J2W97_000805 [Paenibacillus jamilae]|nr:hypothetical protein [Paenibacillus jamilae]